MRETCAQVLGVTAIHLDVDCVHNIARKIVQFLTRSEWEVRHGGLLGLKYILAARQVHVLCCSASQQIFTFLKLREVVKLGLFISAASSVPVVPALHLRQLVSDTLWANGLCPLGGGS